MTPLAELHVHLEGSVEPDTLLEIDSSLTRDEIMAETSYTDFPGFIRSYVWVNRKIETPAHYALIARRLFERLAGEGVTYAEVILSVGVMLWKGADFAPIWNAVAAEAARSPIPIRWIFDATRQFGAEAAKPVFELAAERIHEGVVAIGMGGFEDGAPAGDFAELYRLARDGGLHTVSHAGETTTAQNVWEALAIGAERIGHGIRAIDDPKLLDHLREHDIPLEISISSNVRTGSVQSVEHHPVRELFDAGVPIILNTDDPALFGCTLTSEYELARSAFGFTEAEIAAVQRNAFRYAFTAL
jgi:adenosine deaminase/aminodeoxyfutalosine deaminase